ncbi:MAG: MBL fold metallo-hydrolase [Candidatus Marinimicrobia bacterium]|nr:MBL fold metallo-hydrolase [Candidatus Neomarinimicrobiota bacterium]
MNLIILGSGTSVPSKKRKSSSYLLEIDGVVNLIDCGPGALHQLAHTQYTTKDISNIFISHTHLDHISDLFTIFFANRYYVQKNSICNSFMVYSSKENINVLKNIDKIHRYLTYDDNNKYEFIELNNGDSIEYEQFKLFTLSTIHSKGSLMFKFVDRKNLSFVYAGDTGLCENLCEISFNVDYLLIECSLPDSISLETHMTPYKVRELAKASKPKNIILTHFYPEIDKTDELFVLKDELIKKYGINVIISSDLMSLELR